MHNKLDEKQLLLILIVVLYFGRVSPLFKTLHTWNINIGTERHGTNISDNALTHGKCTLLGKVRSNTGNVVEEGYGRTYNVPV